MTTIPVERELLERVLGCIDAMGWDELEADIRKLLAEQPQAGAGQDTVEATLNPQMKLPCEIKLPGGMTIGKGCELSTLVLALRNRGDDMPWRQRFDVPVPFDPALMNMAALTQSQKGEEE